MLDVANVTRAAVETVGKERWLAKWHLCWPQRWVHPTSLRRVSRILEVLVWRCHARVPYVLGSCLKFLMTPRDRALIKEMNESGFALNYLETGGISLPESCEKVECSILSTDWASPAIHRLHSVTSDFRPPSVTESCKASLRRLLASRAIRPCGP